VLDIQQRISAVNAFTRSANSSGRGRQYTSSSIFSSTCRNIRRVTSRSIPSDQAHRASLPPPICRCLAGAHGQSCLGSGSSGSAPAASRAPQGSEPARRPQCSSASVTRSRTPEEFATAPPPDRPTSRRCMPLGSPRAGKSPVGPCLEPPPGSSAPSLDRPLPVSRPRERWPALLPLVPSATLAPGLSSCDALSQCASF